MNYAGLTSIPSTLLIKFSSSFLSFHFYRIADMMLLIESEFAVELSYSIDVAY